MVYEFEDEMHFMMEKPSISGNSSYSNFKEFVV